MITCKFCITPILMTNKKFSCTQDSLSIVEHATTRLDVCYHRNTNHIKSHLSIESHNN